MISLENIPLPVQSNLLETGEQLLSLHMKRGEIVWLYGPAGAGKSALLDTLALQRRPKTGQMRIMNYDAGPKIKTRTRRLLQCRLGYIHAAPIFIPHLNIADNIALPLELGHFRKADILKETESIIHWFGLETYAPALPHQLSMTTLLRAACARALIAQPSIILVDEPALTLCPVLRDILLKTVHGLVQNGAAALFATQTMPSINTIESVSERVITLPYKRSTPSEEIPPFMEPKPLAPASPPETSPPHVPLPPDAPQADIEMLL